MPLLHFGDSEAKFTVRDSFNGLSIMGQVGSGKSTSSGAIIAKRFLMAGYGGLVITCKPSDCDDWVKYCADTGRTKDLVVLAPGRKERFNFLEYLSQQKIDGRPITENIVDVFNTVIRAEERKQSQSDDSFWEHALTVLIGMLVDLTIIAYGKTTLDLLYNIVQTLPRPDAPVKNEKKEKQPPTPFELAYKQAAYNIKIKESAWRIDPKTERKKFKDSQSYEDALYEAVPDARLFNYVTEYFLVTFRNLNPKTRYIVEYILSGFLYSFLRDPVYSLLCKGESTFKPEDCFKKASVIIINLPIKVYNKVGRMCQTLIKYLAQLSFEKRRINDESLPVFIWIDEAHNTLHEKDVDFLTTSRSSRIATVMITQSKPNYYMALGGEESRHQVDSLLSNLSTKIWHCNNCLTTNTWASDILGEDYLPDVSMSSSFSKGDFNNGENVGLKLQKLFRPERFSTLKVGGPPSFESEAVVYKQGVAFRRYNFAIISFKQQF